MIRNLRAAATERFDLIVIGGGIYGIALALQSARNGLRPLLIERGDFGQATSGNSLRILHGGLRYLQTLDISRFRESVGERSWFLRHFPELTEPLPCLMPLYGKGLRRRKIMRLALAANDLLSRNRNLGLSPEHRLPRSRILSAHDTEQMFPKVDRRGLEGAALWHDAFIRHPQRLLIEMLRWACSLGASACNYLAGHRILQARGRVTGLEAIDQLTGDILELQAPVVVNCAGPWSQDFAERQLSRAPGLFQPTLAFNVLLDGPAPAGVALAVSPRGDHQQTYFLLPLHGRTLAGTCHAMAADELDQPAPSEQQMHQFLLHLREVIPALPATPERVLRVYAGLLPARTCGSNVPSRRPQIVDHSRHGGARGFFSVSGIKLTTARAVAGKVLRTIYANKTGRCPQMKQDANRPSVREIALRQFPLENVTEQDAWRAPLAKLVVEESVVRLSDLVLRRTGWADRPEQLPQIARAACGLLEWDDVRTREELDELDGNLPFRSKSPLLQGAAQL